MATQCHREGVTPLVPTTPTRFSGRHGAKIAAALALASVLVLTLSHVPASQHSLWLSQSAKAEEQAAASSVDVTGINAKYDGVNFCLNAKNSKMMTTDEKPPSVFKSFQTLQVAEMVENAYSWGSELGAAPQGALKAATAHSSWLTKRAAKDAHCMPLSQFAKGSSLMAGKTVVKQMFAMKGDNGPVAIYPHSGMRLEYRVELFDSDDKPVQNPKADASATGIYARVTIQKEPKGVTLQDTMAGHPLAALVGVDNELQPPFKVQAGGGVAAKAQWTIRYGPDADGFNWVIDPPRDQDASIAM